MLSIFISLFHFYISRNNFFSVFRVVLSTYALPTELLRNIRQKSEFLRIFGSGNDLLSRAVTHQVSSTLRSLTSVFGMGTGGASSLLPPDYVCFRPIKVLPHYSGVYTLKTKQYFHTLIDSILRYSLILSSYLFSAWSSPRPISTG